MSRRRNNKIAVVAIVIFISGCASVPKTQEHGARCRLPAFETEAGQNDVHPGQAYPWRKSPKADRAHAFRQYLLERTPSGSALSFARMRGGRAPTGTWPVIFAHGKSGWQELSLKADFPGWEWAYVAQDFERKRIWAVLESAVEGGAHALPVLASVDGGQSWQLQAYVQKPRFTAVLSGFKMSPGGEGRMTFALDVSECANSKELPAGARAVFTTQTQDAGAHWRLDPDSEIESTLDRPHGPSLECVEAFEAMGTIPGRCGIATSH